MPLIRNEIIERADALYKMRENIACVQESVSLLQPLKNDYEALWRLSRAHFFLGQEASQKEKLRQHLEGTKAGAEAVMRAAKLKYEKRVEAYFWLGVNRALLASLDGAIKALFNALGARHCLNKAIEHDATYHAAGPLRVLARLESKLPFLLGGNRLKAQKHYEQAIEIAPTNTVTRIYFAELLFELKRREEAHRQLEIILQTEPDGVWDFEIRRDKKLAEELLKSS